MREAVEVMARNAARRHYARRFGKPMDDPHVSMNVEGNWRALYGADMEAALAALDAAGFVVVPSVSSVTMDVAGTIHLRDSPSDASGCYEAMLATAQVEG